MPRPILATIKTSALAHNLGVARKCAPQSKVWAVVKANAYGHGLVAAARALHEADGYAMLDFEEAIRLRLQSMPLAFQMFDAGGLDLRALAGCAQLTIE